jgi:hypothetical protein
MNVRRPAQLAFFLAPVLSFTACGGNGTAPAHPQTPDVYAVGFDTVGNLYKAVLWKNGVLTTLDSGIYGARAEAVAVANGHVYVAGFEGIAGSNNNVAVLWTDGVPTLLTDGSGIGFAGSVTVSGNDVYVGGSNTIFNSSTGVPTTAIEYWKNGVPVVLNSSPEGGGVNSIVIDGTDVIAAGTIGTTTQTSPNSFTTEPVVTLWTNGVPSPITTGLEFAQTTGMAVQNNHVYIAGSLCATFTPDCSGATLWMDGTAISLTPNYLSEASGVALSGSNVYASVNVSNSTGNTAFLWSNGNLAPLSNDNQSAANCVVTDGSDIYVGGADTGGPGYWKNGSLTYLLGTPTGPDTVASVYAMAVVPAT